MTMNRKEWAVAVKDRDSWTCTNCDFNGNDEMMHAHHIIPWSAGGKNVLGNGKTLCRNCHFKEHRGETSSHALMLSNTKPSRKGSGNDRLYHINHEIKEMSDAALKLASETLTNPWLTPLELLDVIGKLQHALRFTQESFMVSEEIRKANSKRSKAAKIREAKGKRRKEAQ